MTAEEIDMMHSGEEYVIRGVTHDNVRQPKLGIYKIADTVPDLTKATEHSACYDLRAYLHPSVEVKGYGKHNHEICCLPDEEISQKKLSVKVNAGDRLLVPTGLIFDIPEGYSLRVHPRSGLAIKYGITLCNAEGVIDSDYTHQTFITVTNTSDESFVITNGMRMCQAELVKELDYNVEYITEPPKQKTSRSGGLGHTGTK
jgi:dUTP pyrophosphatase